MDQKAQEKLARLNASYEAVTGRPAQHFFCPILYRDEDVELCKAHIVNSSFPNSDRTWTIQRADVDNRFGSILESEFVKLQHRGKHDPVELLTDPRLAKQLQPKIRVEGEEIDYFRTDDPVPNNFSPLLIEGHQGTTHLALKLTPDETLAALDKDWQVEVEADVRVPALGSLLKSAHLTMFEMMEYEYALSAGGYFVGRTILGEFILSTRTSPKKAALEKAQEHFGQFANLVRPIISAPEDLQGTVTDGLLYLCMQGEAPWAILVLVRTGELLHAVMLPVFEEAERSARFIRFMENPSELIEVRLGRLAGDHWEISPTPRQFRWPEANFA